MEIPRSQYPSSFNVCLIPVCHIFNIFSKLLQSLSGIDIRHQTFKPPVSQGKSGQSLLRAHIQPLLDLSHLNRVQWIYRKTAKWIWTSYLYLKGNFHSRTQNFGGEIFKFSDFFLLQIVWSWKLNILSKSGDKPTFWQASKVPFYYQLYWIYIFRSTRHSKLCKTLMYP